MRTLQFLIGLSIAASCFACACPCAAPEEEAPEPLKPSSATPDEGAQGDDAEAEEPSEITLEEPEPTHGAAEPQAEKTEEEEAAELAWLPQIYPVRVYRSSGKDRLEGPNVVRNLGSQYGTPDELRDLRFVLGLPANKEARRLPRWPIALLSVAVEGESILSIDIPSSLDKRTGPDRRLLAPNEFPKPTPPPGVPFWMLGEERPCRMEPDRPYRVRYIDDDGGAFDGVALKGSCPGLDGLRLAVQQKAAPPLHIFGPHLVHDVSTLPAEIQAMIKLEPCPSDMKCRIYQRVEQVMLPSGHGLLYFAVERIKLAANGEESCAYHRNQFAAGRLWLRPDGPPKVLLQTRSYPPEYHDEDYLLLGDNGQMALLKPAGHLNSITIIPVDPEQGPFSEEHPRLIQWDTYEGQYGPSELHCEDEGDVEDAP